MTLYRNIQEECRKQGISIIAMEEELGFSRGSICKWDVNIPSVLKVKKVADRLNTTVDALLQ